MQQKRKCVRFERDDKKLFQVKYFCISEEPSAPALQRDEIIPLREILQQRGGQALRDMKRTDMLMEKTMNKNQKLHLSHPPYQPSFPPAKPQAQQPPPQSTVESKVQILMPYKLYNLDLQDGFQQPSSEQMNERQTQRRREMGIMQVIYFKELLIPSDPLEQAVCSDGPYNSTNKQVPVTVTDAPRRSLEDYYRDWRKDQEDRRKETRTVVTLCETL